MRFTLFSIPVTIRPSFWIFVLFFSDLLVEPSMKGVIVSGVLFVSLLLHEYGHALTAGRYGAQAEITLEAFGGYASYTGPTLSRWQRFMVVLNGPLFESLLIFIPYYLLSSGVGGPYMRYTLAVTVRLNVLWCLFNLLPLAPLDGSKLLFLVLDRIWPHRAEAIARVFALVSAAVVIPLCMLKGLYMFAVMVAIFAFKYVKMRPAPSLYSRYQEGIRLWEEGDAVEAEKVLRRLVRAKDDYIRKHAGEALAEMLCEQEAFGEALELVDKGSERGIVLLGQIAYQQGNYSFIVEHAYTLYEKAPTYETALRNAKAFAHVGEGDKAVGWLETASRFEGAPAFEVLCREVGVEGVPVH